MSYFVSGSEKGISFVVSTSKRLYISNFTTCGDNSVAAKRNLVEILRFRHFSRHVVFDAEGDKFRNKRIEDYITVSVVIDMECGNTKN